MIGVGGNEERSPKVRAELRKEEREERREERRGDLYTWRSNILMYNSLQSKIDGDGSYFAWYSGDG